MFACNWIIFLFQVKAFEELGGVAYKDGDYGSETREAEGCFLAT